MGKRLPSRRGRIGEPETPKMSIHNYGRSLASFVLNIGLSLRGLAEPRTQALVPP
jgi:hypothetical protein